MKFDGVVKNHYALVYRTNFILCFSLGMVRSRTKATEFSLVLVLVYRLNFQMLIPQQTVSWVASPLSKLWFPSRHNYKMRHRNHKFRGV